MPVRADPRLKTERVKVPSPNRYGSINGYLCRPASAAATAKLPGILVIHENRGLTPHIEDITRRLALEGFMALGPDALSSLGDYPGDEEKAVDLFKQLDLNKTRQDFLASAQWLRSRRDSNGKLGATGFCIGGGFVLWVATQMPDLTAAAPFYSPYPAPAEAARIKAPLLIHMASNDNFVNPGWPAFEAVLKQSGVPYTAYTYPNTQHGFHNDTTPRYEPEAAKLAWSRTIGFCKTQLA